MNNIKPSLASLKWIFHGFLIVILSGCTIQFHQDLTDNPKFEHFARRCIELKEDVFLMYYSGSNNIKSYTLEPPRVSSSVPPSIAAYMRTPEAWNTYTEKILGVVAKGTRLNVYNVSYVYGLATDSTRFYTTVDDPRFCKLPVNLMFLINTNFVSAEVGIEYDINHRYLKYCEE